MNTSVGDTTDKIDYRDLRVTGTINKRDFLWPYLNEGSDHRSSTLSYYHRYQKGNDFKFKFNELGYSYTHRLFEAHELKATLGAYHYDELYVSDESIKPWGQLNTINKINELFLIELDLGHGLAIRELFLTRTGLDSLEASFMSMKAKYQLFDKKLDLQLLTKKHWLENDVDRSYLDLSAMVSVMTFPHWVRVGIGYHTLDFNRADPHYWSPTDFYSFGPRADFSYSFKDNLSAYLGGSYSWFKENNTFSGNGHYARTGVRYGIRENHTIDFSYERTESAQNNSKWVGESFIFNLQYYL